MEFGGIRYLSRVVAYRFLLILGSNEITLFFYSLIPKSKKIPTFDKKINTMSKIYFFIIILGVTFASCQSTEVKEDLLFGQWKLKEGFRNDKASNLLEGIYFNINKPSGVVTNFTGMEESGQFELIKDELTISTSQKTKFDVTLLTEEQLELETIIRGTPFRFVLEKE